MTDAERTAAHEAGHACACVMLGVPVRLVDTVGDARYRGTVRHGLEDIRTPEDAQAHDHYPLRPDRVGRSVGRRAVVAAQPGRLDRRVQPPRARRVSPPRRAGLQADLLRNLQLAASEEYHLLHVAVTGMLGYFPRIGTHMIDRLERMAREARDR